MHCRGLDHSKREWLILFQKYVHLFGVYSRVFLLLLYRSAQIRRSNFFYHLVRQLKFVANCSVLFQYCYLGGEFVPGGRITCFTLQTEPSLEPLHVLRLMPLRKWKDSIDLIIIYIYILEPYK